jgi:hypothetical protein
MLIYHTSAMHPEEPTIRKNETRKVEPAIIQKAATEKCPECFKRF